MSYVDKQRRLFSLSNDHVYTHMSDAAQTFESQLTGFSDDNPYYQQMFNARNRQDFFALREKAIEYEANLHQYNMQLSDQERMSDPLYQLQRQRAAGLNPDLAGGSSGGSGYNSVSAPQMADTELSEMSTPYKTADRVFAGMTATASLITSVSGAVTSGFDMFKQISTFGDFLRGSAAAASSAESHAIIDSENAKLAPQVAAAGLKAQHISNNAAELSQLWDVVSSVPEDLDEASFGTLLEAQGLGHMKSLGNLYRSKPEFAKAYHDKMLAARDAAAKSEATPLQFLREMYTTSNTVQMLTLKKDRSIAAFELAVNEMVNTRENAAAVAETLEDEIGTSQASADLQRQQAERAVSVYMEQLNQLGGFINEAISREQSAYDAYQKNPNDPLAKANFHRAQIERANLEALANDQLTQMYSIVDGWNSREFINDTLVDTEDGQPFRFAADRKGRFIDVHNFMFSTYYDAANSKMDFGPLGTILNTVVSAFVGGAAGKVFGQSGKAAGTYRGYKPRP